jgi:leader peptidase (prepilin peptidase)/N-methyltransferase
MTIFYVLAALLGAAFGSFLNVVIHRLPGEGSPLTGRSKCPGCGSVIRFYDNIPIVSFIILGGRCRNCAARISIRYPLVELLALITFLVNFHLFGVSWKFLWASVFVMMLIPMAFIDAKHYILPNELTIGGFLFAIVMSIARYLPWVNWPLSFKEALIGSVVGGGFLLVVSTVGSALLKKEVMGEGDVKMMAMIGAFLGWKSVFLTIFLGSLLGTLVFGPISLRRKILVPFGVFLAIGGVVSLYFLDDLIRIYWGLFI